MPDGITDRNADVWESLLSVADAVGGPWPERARVAAVALVADAMGGQPSLGVRLLTDLRTIFGDREKMWTSEILTELLVLDESPWGDLKGKPLDARKLAVMLKNYGVIPEQVRLGEKNQRGYLREKFLDVWLRYIPDKIPDLLGLSTKASATSATSATNEQAELLVEEEKC